MTRRDSSGSPRPEVGKKHADDVLWRVEDELRRPHLRRVDAGEREILLQTAKRYEALRRKPFAAKNVGVDHVGV